MVFTEIPIRMLKNESLEVNMNGIILTDKPKTSVLSSARCSGVTSSQESGWLNGSQAQRIDAMGEAPVGRSRGKFEVILRACDKRRHEVYSAKPVASLRCINASNS
jgi:hypothetical protein